MYKVIEKSHQLKGGTGKLNEYEIEELISQFLPMVLKMQVSSHPHSSAGLLS